MSAQPTMTEAEVAAWERSARAGTLYRETAGWLRRTRSADIREYLAEHYPSRCIPWGYLALIAARFDVAPQQVQELAARGGWVVGPRPEGMANAGSGAVLPGMRGAAVVARVRERGAGDGVAPAEVAQQRPGGGDVRMRNHLACRRCGGAVENIVKHYQQSHGGVPAVRRMEGS